MAGYPHHRFAVAPMMDWTDRWCRLFHRRLSRHALLYTEMVTSAAVIHGDRDRLLGFFPEEHPVALQLGGSDPAELAAAARIAADYGYDEVNLNVGCPSDRVQSGRFGACLMREPALVGDCVAALRAAVSIPVTVKCRIGVDDQDPEEALDTLADAVVAAGTDAIWVHARKAWLKGLSPKENRDVPPLDYGRVRRLKARLPQVFVGINGGIGSLEAAEAAIAGLDGVMLGRAAYHEPALLAAVDRRFYGETGPDPDLFEVVDSMRGPIADHLAKGGRVGHVARHMLGLFQGRPGARAFRRILTEGAVEPGAGLEVLDAALAALRRPARSAA
ncbi:tRNA dihydrouridine(20/20a) synthase DusA [Oharaeibacter diazotrophicus]|uniref:tRNA-dihydrouridine(20/20a) synthase n=2 Tax=Oharaeibacter diazotrophicus TaxID=1920512 RepID=A0A4R6RIB7_9HYPH|nr:tRNA dihydrouridine(20/20a) synthase DusA [Oharaeibacter diazotrophicus]TDP86193.1 tRNA-U16,U17-dihydrouridine synthase [Oharaeibacter diazotrophicus]BBE71866.1 tRNA-dihydrouridine synthase C [Pleomorphomonas sp. SM30]GLS78630.1 tRNA-dihydrouridine(20/20a) synthase [Oharaeibacter diazotrophicus]